MIIDYFQEYDDSGYFWIDPVANTIKEFNTNELTSIGTAYMKPYHLDSYKPGNTVWTRLSAGVLIYVPVCK